MFRFRHELVREALGGGARTGGTGPALLHRQTGRVLDRRSGVDPLTVAGHARLGGDLALASRRAGANAFGAGGGTLRTTRRPEALPRRRDAAGRQRGTAGLARGAGPARWRGRYAEALGGT